MAVTERDVRALRTATPTARPSERAQPLDDLHALFGGSLPPDAVLTVRWRSRTAQLFRIQGTGPRPWNDVVVKVPDRGRSFDPLGVAEQSRWFEEVLRRAGIGDSDVPLVLGHDLDMPALCFPYIEGDDLTDLFRGIDAARRDELLRRCGRLLGALHLAGRQDEVLGAQERVVAVTEAEKLCRRVGTSYQRV